MKEHDLNIDDFILDEIESIEFIGDTTTIDITVEDVHLFYANDIYTHNSGYQETVIQGQHIAEAFEKIMISDFVASISRNDNDKLHGKGRFHIIKNRMGADGITLPADMDLSIGDIKIHPPGDPALSRQLKNSNQSESDTIRELLGKRYDKIEKSNTNFG
jgi:hypothetical protein